jgi:hypothetical protein
MKENKQKILDLMLPALQETSNLHDLTSLMYDYDRIGDREIVIAVFNNKYSKIADVTGDSGTAMISDILRAII